MTFAVYCREGRECRRTNGIRRMHVHLLYHNIPENGYASTYIGAMARIRRTSIARWRYRSMYSLLLIVGRLGQRGGNPILVTCAGLGYTRLLCQARRAGARCAGVVQRLVVRRARCAERDRMLGVIPLKARRAGVVLCQCGAVMRAAGQRR